MPNLPPVLLLMGPTASGKSHLAVQLASKYNAEIISVDSALVYRGMDIGTAKPDMAERMGIPHYLIDILDPCESYSTASFRKSALELIQQILERGKIPLLVGGTMLYFNALLNGLAELPEADETIRNRLQQEWKELGALSMYERLKAVDPESAIRIHPNDPQRLLRALEVYEITGKAMSCFFQQARSEPLPYDIVKLVLQPDQRQVLHERIAQRFMSMVDNGLIAEVETLFQRPDLNESLPAIRAVGYRQVWQYLQGHYDQPQMLEKGIIATRQLAKRQLTWLRKEADAEQFNCCDSQLHQQVFSYLSGKL